MGLIIPKCNAEPETLDLTLKVYYDANDWVTNADLIDRLSRSLLDAGIETEKKEPQSYTKKTQVLSYYGLIEWEDPFNNQSKRRITDNGRKLYEYRMENKVLEIQSLLIDVLRNNTFGRNVLGCDSDSDLEAPNIFLKSAMLIKDLTNKEFAYILGKLEYTNADLVDVLFDITMKRNKGETVVPDSASAKWADPKPILALADWGLFEVSKQGNSKYYNVNRDVLQLHSDDLMTLRTRNTEAKRNINISTRSTFQSSENMNDTINQFITAIRTKPFILLAGISGTGKSRIVRKLAQATDDIDNFANDNERWECHAPENFKLIQVKPNWHNSMDVVGYKSNIGGEHYEFTPFVEFVAKAWQYPNTPFFLCLDEMNLAPVEEYFAEYLSAIESRTLENGVYETDPIIKPFKEFGENLSAKMITKLLGNNGDNDIAKRFREKGLTLPQNLIVMGTVNMDDTTFSFSRKVLDRAMSIEMNEVNYDAFLNGDTEDDVPKLVDKNTLLIDRPVKGTEVKDDVEADKVMQYLKDINEVLDGTPFKLGYRAANEALLYVSAAQTWGNDDLAEALDQFTLMKILSRIEGDESKLMADDDKTILDCLKETIEQHLAGEDRKCLKKIAEMAKILQRDHFVSYWA